MASRFLAALRTYATRRDFWFLVGCCLLPLCIGMAVSGNRTPGPGSANDVISHLFLFLAVNGVLGMMVGIQLKLQFANPRARLLPGFAASHLLAAGAILAAAVILEVGLLVLARGASALAVAGFALVVIAAATWACSMVQIALSRFFTALAAGVVIASVYFAGSIEAHLLGGNPIASLAELCVGLAILAALGVRLWVLSEETPDYSLRVPDSVWDFTSRAARRDRHQLEARVIARSPTRGRLYDLGLRLALRSGTTSGPLRRLLLHQAAGGFSGLFFAPTFVVFIVYVFWLQRWFERATGTGSGPQFFMVSSFFPVVVAMSLLGGLWVRRLPYLARESLHPLSRTAFVRNFIGSGLCDTAAVAAGHCAGVVVGLVVFHVQWPLTAIVLPYLAMTVVQYFAMCCVTLWVVSFRSIWVLVFGNVLATPLTAGLVVAAVSAGEEFWSPVRIALAVAATISAIAMLYRLTLRRWCSMELD